MKNSKGKRIDVFFSSFMYLKTTFHILHIILQNNSELRVCVKGVLFNQACM